MIRSLTSASQGAGPWGSRGRMCGHEGDGDDGWRNAMCCGMLNREVVGEVSVVEVSVARMCRCICASCANDRSGRPSPRLSTAANARESMLAEGEAHTLPQDP